MIKLDNVYVIANPPYCDLGANIIDKIRTSVDFKDFITLLPLDHYPYADNKELVDYVSDAEPMDNDYAELAAIVPYCSRIYKTKEHDELTSAGLTEEQKYYIKLILEDKDLADTIYKGLNEERRYMLAQFYATPDACITILNKLSVNDFSEKVFLDPTCGSGQLLIAAIASGADTTKIFGNEYDYDAYKLCIERINLSIDKLNALNAYGISNRPHIEPWQIHQGNALISDCLNYFGPEYNKEILIQLFKRRPELDNSTYWANPDKAEKIK